MSIHDHTCIVSLFYKISVDFNNGLCQNIGGRVIAPYMVKSSVEAISFEQA